MLLMEFTQIKRVLSAQESARSLLNKARSRLIIPRSARLGQFRQDPLTEPPTDATTTDAPTTIAGTTVAATEAPTTAAVDVTTEPAEEGSGDDTDHNAAVQEVSQATQELLETIAANYEQTLETFKTVVSDLSASFDEIVDKLPLENILALFPSLGDIDIPGFSDLPIFGGDDEEGSGDDNTPAEGFITKHWNKICKIVWWPYHDEHCNGMRCTACAPTIMASAQVCKKSIGRVSQRCMQEVMGETGFCNFCIVDYINSY
jgi:hypothetical protein